MVSQNKTSFKNLFNKVSYETLSLVNYYRQHKALPARHDILISNFKKPNEQETKKVNRELLMYLALFLKPIS